VSPTPTPDPVETDADDPRAALASLAEFWGDSLDLRPIRFVESPLARLAGRAFVTHNTVHWPGPPPASASDPWMSTLVHELAHCWQHQTGAWQLGRGVIEQALYTLFGLPLVRLGFVPWYDPYDYGGPTGLAGTGSLSELRLEAQATVIEHRWLAARGAPRVGGATSPAGASAPVGGARGSPAGWALIDDRGRPTPYALDLERLCTGAGLPPRGQPW